MKIVRAIHTGMVVSDIDKSIAFYRDGLGLSVTDKIRHAGEHVSRLVGIQVSGVHLAFVSLPNWEIELLQYDVPAGNARSSSRPSDIGCMHLSLQVESVDRALVTMAGAGFYPVGVVMSPQSGPRKGGKIVYTQDPDGNVIELAEMPSKGSEGP